jgi:hypothetical protein
MRRIKTAGYVKDFNSPLNICMSLLDMRLKKLSIQVTIIDYPEKIIYAG